MPRAGVSKPYLFAVLESQTLQPQHGLAVSLDLFQRPSACAVFHFANERRAKADLPRYSATRDAVCLAKRLCVCARGPRVEERLPASDYGDVVHGRGCSMVL